MKGGDARKASKTFQTASLVGSQTSPKLDNQIYERGKQTMLNMKPKNLGFWAGVSATLNAAVLYLLWGNTTESGSLALIVLIVDGLIEVVLLKTMWEKLQKSHTFAASGSLILNGLAIAMLLVNTGLHMDVIRNFVFWTIAVDLVLELYAFWKMENNTGKEAK